MAVYKRGLFTSITMNASRRLKTTPIDWGIVFQRMAETFHGFTADRDVEIQVPSGRVGYCVRIVFMMLCMGDIDERIEIDGTPDASVDIMDTFYGIKGFRVPKESRGYFDAFPISSHAYFHERCHKLAHSPEKTPEKVSLANKERHNALLRWQSTGLVETINGRGDLIFKFNQETYAKSRRSYRKKCVSD